MAAWTYPEVDPIAFSAGPLDIHWYGLAYVAGFLVGIMVVTHLNRRWGLGLSSADLTDILLAATVAVLLGGRLGYVLLYNPSYYLENPGRIVAVWDGGMAFHGALAAMVFAGWLMSRRLPISVLRLIDLGAIATPIGLFFGRLANFVNGELWGRTSDVPWAMVFPGAGPIPRHPSQLYEALAEGLVIFAVLWLLSRKMRPEGTYIGVFLVLYGLARFAIEFVREPDVQLGLVLGPFSMGQLLTVPVLVAGVWLIVRGRRSGDDPAQGAGPDGQQS